MTRLTMVADLKRNQKEKLKMINEIQINELIKF